MVGNSQSRELMDSSGRMRLVRELRFLAGEFRDCRRSESGYQESSRLEERLTKTLHVAFEARCLPEPILEAIQSDIDSNSGPVCFLYEFYLSSSVIGYFESDEWIEQMEYDDETNSCWGGHHFLYLKPGFVALVWPDVFLPVFRNEYLRDGDDKKELTDALKTEHRFSIVGYYASGCDLLAEWIERQVDATEKDGKHLPAAKVFENCVSADGRTLRWGGLLYPLGPSAAGVVRILAESYESGFPFLHEDHLKTEAETETDIRRLVRDNGLDGVVVRATSPNGKPIRGMWGLIDPNKNSDPQKVHG